MRQNLLLGKHFDDGNESDIVTEPVLLAEARKRLAVDITDFDDIIQELITTARQQCEHYLGISLIERTVTAYLQIELPFSSPEHELPYGPVNEVISITDDTEVRNEIENYTLNGTDYKIISGLGECRIYAEYTAGFAIIPQVFKTGILQQIAFLYEARGDEVKLSQLSPMTVITLKPYRRIV